MKTLLRVLSYIELICGVVGTTILANDLGKVTKVNYASRIYYERNWGATMVAFLAGIFSVLVLFSILNALANILEAQEKISEKLNIVPTTVQKNEKSVGYVHDGEYRAPENSVTNEWVCPKCGKHNADYVGTCGCGTVKPNLKNWL